MGSTNPGFSRTSFVNGPLQKRLKILSLLYTVNPRFSPRGLIVNFEIWHGSLFEGELIRGRGLIEKICTLHGGLFETACFLHAIIILW